VAQARTEYQSRIVDALRGILLELSPYVFAILAFAGGAMVLASAATPAIAERLEVLTEFTPFFVIEFSHFAASIIGLLLMLVGSGLWRRRQGAYWTAITLALIGAVVSLTKGLEYEYAGGLVAFAALLLPCRSAFDRPSRLFSSRPGSIWIVATVGAVLSAGALGFFVFRNVPYTGELWWTFLRDADASRFLRAGVAVAVLTLAAALITLFAAPAQWRGRPSAQDLLDAETAIAGAEVAPPDAALALVGDKDLLFSDSRNSFIAFRVRASRWIAMGDPVGLAAERQALMWRFAEFADRAGAQPVFYRASSELLPLLAAMGYVIRQVGEAAIVDVQAFSLRGKAQQNLRTARNRCEAEGAVFELVPAGSAQALARDLKQVSDAWLQRQAGGEKGFSMGRFDIAYLNRTPIGLVHKGDRVVAFANVLVAGGRATIDLMRYADDAPPGVMDYLFVNLIEWARDQGIAEFSLGMAPLSGLENRRLAPLFARIGALVFAEGGALYGFEGLRAYKAKFADSWRPLYIAGRPGTIMPLALLDVALLTSGGWRGLLPRG
jgi:phosphatidylglycerol lysyltransferase